MSEISLEEQFINAFGLVIKGSRMSGELFFKCPQCGKRGLSCNIRSGFYYCHSCGFGRGKPPFKGEATAGPVQQVDKTIQRAVFERVASMSTLSARHYRYLEERGIYNPISLGFRTVPFGFPRTLLPYFTRKELILSGLFYPDSLEPAICLTPGRILIPYWHMGRIVTYKSREDPDSWEENSPRYAFPRGVSSAENLFCMVPELSGDVILTEGELKVVVAHLLGIQACAIPGVAAQGNALVQLKKYLPKIDRVFVVFDTDEEFKLAVAKNAVSVVNTLGNKAGLVFLPDFGLGKMDLDRFLLLAGPEYLTQVLNHAWFFRHQTYRNLRRQIDAQEEEDRRTRTYN